MAERANYFNYNLERGTVKGRFKQDLSDLFCILATHIERRKMPTASFVGQVRNGTVSLAKERLQQIHENCDAAQFLTGLEKTRVFLKKTQPSGFFWVFLGFFGFFWVFLPGREGF